MGRSRYAIVLSDGTFLRVDDNQIDATPVILNPGDFALVSSEEQLSLSSRVAGAVGAKFDFIRRGMLVITGINVDPGYGSDEPKPLHFLLANMGDRPLPLTPGDTKVATIQFHDIGATAGPLTQPLSNVDPITNQFFARDKPDLALDLFSGLADIRRLTGESGRTSAQLADVSSRLTRVEGQVTGLSEGANQIILFGVILLATTLAGVVTAVMLQGGLWPNGKADAGRMVGAAGALALFAVGTGAIVALMFVFGSWFQGRRERRAPPAPPSAR